MTTGRNEDLGEQMKQNEDTNMSIHYASGAFRRLAEEKGDERHHDLSEYDHPPTIEELVEDMVDKGFDESEARAAAQTLFDDEIYDNAT